MDEIHIDQENHLEYHIHAMEEISYSLRWAAQRRLDQLLERYHLTIPQFSAMRVIAKHEQTCRMSNLSAAAHQVMPTMTGIIDRLVDRGLVQRVRDENDRRALRITLTAEGQRILGEIIQIKHAEMSRFLSSLSLEERDNLIGLMTRYLNDVQASIENQSTGAIQ